MDYISYQINFEFLRMIHNKVFKFFKLKKQYLWISFFLSSRIENYDDNNYMDDEMEAAYEEFLKSQSQVQGRHHHW